MEAWRGEEEDDGARGSLQTASVDKLDKLDTLVRCGGLRCHVRCVPRSLRVCDCADLGDAVPGCASGAAAGRAALRLDAEPGAGGAFDSGSPGPDPGGGTALRLNHIQNFLFLISPSLFVNSVI